MQQYAMKHKIKRNSASPRHVLYPKRLEATPFFCSILYKILHPVVPIHLKGSYLRLRCDLR